MKLHGLDKLEIEIAFAKQKQTPLVTRIAGETENFDFDRLGSFLFQLYGDFQVLAP